MQLVFTGFSHPRSTSIDDSSTFSAQTPSAYSKEVDTDASETTSVASGIKKSSSFGHRSVHDPTRFV